MPNPLTAIFPGALPNDGTLYVATNRGVSQLTADLTSNQTTIPVSDASKFNVPCLVQIDTEIIRVDDVSGNNLISCTRGFDSSIAAVHLTNTYVKAYILAHHHNQTTAEIKAICAALGENLENVVTVTDIAGGDMTGNFANLTIKPNGMIAGTYGSTAQTPVVTVDDIGRVTAINLTQSGGTGNRVLPIFYKAAIAQGSNAVLGFSFGLTNAPSAVIVNQGNQIYGVASFTEANNYAVQDHFWLPDDWTGVIDLDIYWRAPVTIGAVTWQVRIAGMRAGSASDIQWPPWAAPATVTDLATTPLNGVNICTIPAIDTTDGFSHQLVFPGDELFFEFSRQGTASSDSMNAAAELIALRFRIRRNWTLGVTSA